MPPPPHPRRTTAPQRTVAGVWGVEIPMRRQGKLESCRRISGRHAAEVNAREVTGASPGGNDVNHSIRRSWSRIRPSTPRSSYGAAARNKSRLLGPRRSNSGSQTIFRWRNAIPGCRFIPILTRRWAAGCENGRLLLLGLESGLVGIGRTNHQLEGAAVTQSNGCEVTHVARGQTTDAERLGERYNRPIDEAQANIREASVHFHRT